MSEPVLPPWESDELSAFLSTAERNERVTALKMPDVYVLLQRVHAAFVQVASITEKEHNENLLVTRFLMARARSAWLAATRQAMSGQIVEAYPLMRVIVENAWYALHLAKDPNPPTRAKIWLNRDDANDAKAEARCATEFSIKNVSETHAALDAATEAACHAVYKRTIELGGHPNERGVLTAMTKTDTDEERTFHAVFLTNDPALIALALKTGVEAAVGALKTFRLVFPERFAIMGIDGEIDKLVDGLNSIFPRAKH